MTRVCDLDTTGCDVAIFELGCDVIKIYDLSPTDDGCDVKVFLPGPPGPPGPPLADSGFRTSPNLITSSIPAPQAIRQRTFIKGNGGPVLNPTLPDGSPFQEWFLFGCDDIDTVELRGASNLQLSGRWVAANGSLLALQWDNNSMWVEVGRNEI